MNVVDVDDDNEDNEIVNVRPQTALRWFLCPFIGMYMIYYFTDEIVHMYGCVHIYP